MQDKTKYGIVYKGIDPNGKIYIGQTTIKLNKRITNHRKLKYIINDWSIIDKAYTKEELNKKEKYWINFYDSSNPKKGYNIYKCGPGKNAKSIQKQKIKIYSNIKWFNIIDMNCDSTYYHIDKSRIKELNINQRCILRFLIWIILRKRKPYINNNNIFISYTELTKECSYLKNIKNDFMDLLYNHELFNVIKNKEYYNISFLPGIVNRYLDKELIESRFNNQIEKTASEQFNF